MVSRFNKTHKKKFDIVVIGGLGHVGLPLGISFAEKGLKVCLYDKDKQKAELVKKGVMPFIEYGAEPVLKKVLRKKTLEVCLDKMVVGQAQYVIIAIGTPVDEYLNPKTRAFLDFIDSLKKYFNNDQTIIIRSTVYPRTC
jgi:UDP-N-acetyl-D-mannosaminuronic acid dehydrogenase